MHLEILEQHLLLNGTMTHQYAEKLLNVSPATVRRLFREMDQMQKAVRFHGGLSAFPEKNTGAVPIPRREVRQTEEKERLAIRVLSEFSAFGLNLIHGGTTTQRIAKYLTTGMFLTDSVLIAAEVCRKYPGGGGPSLLLTGGALDMTAGFLYGPKTQSVIRSYAADVFVTSVRGIDRQGLLETDDQTVGVMRAMMSASRRTVVIADHLKFRQRGSCRLSGWNEIDLLITSECEENRDDLDYLRKNGVKIELIEPFTKGEIK
jgi:DeoR/GlpR family transcriptional regulator of sugar metabolism